jgi:DNA modification methylase
MTVQILKGDCRDVLKGLADESVHCVVTSPPYWGLRDYGIPPSVWGGDPDCEHDWNEETWYTEQSAGKSGAEAFSGAGPENAARLKLARWRTAATCQRCQAWRGSFGLEPSPDLYVAHAVLIFREVARVLRADGTLWLNLGDSYTSGGRGTFGTYSPDSKQATHTAIKSAKRAPQPVGLKPKDLVGIPWRVAFALQADGWYLRQDIIWSKPNPMPESVTDRCTKAHEYLFLLTKSRRYYFNAEAIAEPCSAATHARLSQDVQAQIGSERAHAGGKTNGNMKAVGRASWKGSTFDGDRDLAVRPDTGRKRAEAGSGIKNNVSMDAALAIMPDKRNRRSVWTINTEGYSEAHFATFPPALVEPCIRAGSRAGGTVLDPFGGAGTVGLVADRLGRNAILIELNPEYADMAERRISGDGGMFANVEVIHGI